MKKKIIYLMSASVFLITVQMAAAPLPRLSPLKDRFTFAVPVKKAPMIDGKLEKEVWGTVPRAKYFQVKDGPTAGVSKQTSFQICYDEKYLYLGATMWESHPARIKEGSRVQDGWPDTDRINFIFSRSYDRKGTYLDSPYIFLMFGAGGIHRGFYNELPQKIQKPLKDESCEWISAYSKDQNRWYLESRIPFKLLGITPADGQVFLNVRRDLMTGPKAEMMTMWSASISPNLDAHSFGTLYFQKNNYIKPHKLEERINGLTSYSYLTGVIKNLSLRKGEYLVAKQRFGSMSGWQEAEAIADKLKKVYDAAVKANPWTISDDFDDLYMEWKRTLDKLEKSSPSVPFAIRTKDAKVLSVKLNGNVIPLKNGYYDFSLIAGINQLEIMAESAGAKPGVQFELKNSPETSGIFSAGAPGADVNTYKAADVTNGYLWSGTRKKVVFRQNLIWHRNYGGHEYAFLAPFVKTWGISPGETALFLHRVYNPKMSGKCNYELIVEVPEGFTRVDDHAGQTWRYYVTKDIKTEKIRIKGKNYNRYTYRWTLPEKMVRNLDFYVQYLGFRHDGYPFKKGETVDFRFRRVIDGDTTDVVNVIKVAELPPVKGGKLRKILFPQYQHFAGANPSTELFTAMVDDGYKAGINSHIMSAKYPWELKRKSVEDPLRNAVKRDGMYNFTWMLFNSPMSGAGRGTELEKLVKKYPDLQAVYYKNSGPLLKNWLSAFCLTNAVGKYRNEFKAAFKKDVLHTIKYGVSNYIFLNDETYPEGDNKNWLHCYCFCNVCKAAFRTMFKIPENEKLNDEIIVTKYAAQWGKWWRYMQKNLLLGTAYEVIRECGGKLWYYHNTHDTEAYKQSGNKYDLVSIPIPGQTYPGSAVQASMDARKRYGEKITGVHQSVGQYHTYFPAFKKSGGFLYSSDGLYFYPEEQKMVLIRLAATTHKGAILESTSFCSAGSLFYMGEATRLIAAYEDLFHDGVRDDKLASSTTFQYPNLLVLKKGDERLVLIFNESHNKPLSGTLKNLKLKPGQKAQIWESGKPYGKADIMKITVPPCDVAAVHIK